MSDVFHFLPPHNLPELCVCGHPLRGHGKRGCLRTEPLPDPPPIRWDENGAEIAWAQRTVRCRCKRSRRTFKPMFTARSRRKVV